MEGIIWLIILISIIVTVVDGDKKKNKNGQKQQSTEKWQQMIQDVRDMLGENTSGAYGRKTSGQSYNRQSSSQSYSRKTSGQSYGKSGSSASQNAYYSAQQQKATKERLQQKYGSQASQQRYGGQTSQQSYAKNASQSDILSRAKGNVQEEAPSKFKQETHAAVCSEYRSHADTAPDLALHQGHSPECDVQSESDILKRVNDLIVMGYDGDMKFDRDFIAEGVDMLNNFSL